MASTLTGNTYGNVEVITSQVAPVRHPRWGYDKPVPLEGASLLLLADETLVVVCDTCGFNGITGHEPYVKPVGEYKNIMKQSDSVMSHQNATHLRTVEHKPLYTDEQIKVVIKMYLKWRAIGKAARMRNWTQCAVDELESLGFKPLRGDKWNPSQLGHLARSYMQDPKFANIKAAPFMARDTKPGESLTDAVIREAINKTIEEARTKPGGKPTLATTARVTVADKGHKDEQLLLPIEEEAAVPAAEPILTFETKANQPAPVQTLEKEKPVVIPQQYPQHPITLTVPQPDKLVIESAYQHVTEQDGEPVFMYNGTLMIGKKVRFEVL